MSPKVLEKLIQTGRKPDQFNYVERMIPCGKKGCQRCPHGPYWYAVYRDGKKVRSIYLGGSLPEELKPYAPVRR